MAAVAGVQMAHYYNVPVSVHGQWSDSVTDDDQNLFEHTYTALMEEHRAVDAIARVSPGGNFLADGHTLRFLREERYIPALLYRGSREGWEASGWKTLRDRAKERAKAILQEHEPNPLPEDISKALDEYVSDVLQALEK